ncbi:hypothetical protein BM1_03447 [Bipolaris maydis]|nr:hypothetical protein BM1_03447 [Bipolaris maydis]
MGWIGRGGSGSGRGADARPRQWSKSVAEWSVVARTSRQGAQRRRNTTGSKACSAVQCGAAQRSAAQAEGADADAGQARPKHCEMQKWLLSVWDGAKVVLVPHMRGCAMAPYRPPLRNCNAQFGSPWHKARPHGPRSAGRTDGSSNGSMSSMSSSSNSRGNVFEMHLERRCERRWVYQPVGCGLAPLVVGAKGAVSSPLARAPTETERFSDSAQYDLASRPPQLGRSPFFA